MKILFLCKRQYVNRDLFDDRFWKYWELPRALGELGSEVYVASVNYVEGKRDFVGRTFEDAAGVTWSSTTVSRKRMRGLAKYFLHLRRLIKTWKPDIIVGASDSIYCIVARFFASIYKKPYVLEIYDNFHAFSSRKLPKVISHYEQAVRKADLTVCFSHSLKELLLEKIPGVATLEVLENAVSEPFLEEYDRTSMKEQFEIRDVPSIGMAGNLLLKNRLSLILEAYDIVSSRYPDVVIHLAGTANSDLKSSLPPAFRHWGRLPHRDIPKLLAAVDIVLVPYDSCSRSKVAFPLRLLEALACNKPFVAARVGDVPRVVGARDEILFEPHSAEGLATAICNQIENPIVINHPIRSWREYAKVFQGMLRSVLKDS